MPLSALSQKTHGNRPRLQANLIGGMSISEARKAKYGDIHDLQEYRYSHFYRCYQGLPGYSRKLLDVEEELREVVQEEISIKEGINTLTKGAKERLRVLDARYFLLKQRWWYSRDSFQKGVQTRAFDLWRSHPRWYMHKALVDDCAGREGCCARRCGCCFNRNIDYTRKLGVGHCTLQCACCRRARSGFDIPEKDRKALRKEFSSETKSRRSYWFKRVSIWGLSMVVMQTLLI